jgi:hypothetical protein
MFKYKTQDVARFWSKVDKSGECWLWTSQLRDGYGTFWLSGKVVGAHRFSLFLEIGEYEGNALHTCDNPQCVRPSHLFPGTQQENMDDMYGKERRNRHQGYQKVSERKVIKLSPQDVVDILEELKKPYWGQVSALARRYGVTHGLISQIKTGKFRPVALISADEEV